MAKAKKQPKMPMAKPMGKSGMVAGMPVTNIVTKKMKPKKRGY